MSNLWWNVAINDQYPGRIWISFIAGMIRTWFLIMVRIRIRLFWRTYILYLWFAGNTWIHKLEWGQDSFDKSYPFHTRVCGPYHNKNKRNTTNQDCRSSIKESSDLVFEKALICIQIRVSINFGSGPGSEHRKTKAPLSWTFLK